MFRPRVNQFRRGGSRIYYGLDRVEIDIPGFTFQMDCRRINKLGEYVAPYDSRAKSREEQVLSQVLLGAVLSYFVNRRAD